MVANGEPLPDAPRMRRGVSAAILIAIAAALAALLTYVAGSTREQIERNELAWIQQRLNSLVPAELHDNDMLADRIAVAAPDLLGITEQVTIYRARRGGQPIAAAIHTVAPDGYRGPIELLIAVRYDGTLIGVQVVRHKETPGLGDAFENRNADWLPRFRGLSLTNPPQQRWTVRKDHGDFDEFTGATITPRAIVKATRRTLEFYNARRDTVFVAPAPKPQ
jgi:electron transport complex protein RnfG